jgi:hypothetical protein
VSAIVISLGEIMESDRGMYTIIIYELELDRRNGALSGVDRLTQMDLYEAVLLLSLDDEDIQLGADGSHFRIKQ